MSSQKLSFNQDVLVYPDGSCVQHHGIMQGWIKFDYVIQSRILLPLPPIFPIAKDPPTVSPY